MDADCNERGGLAADVIAAVPLLPLAAVPHLTKPLSESTLNQFFTPRRQEA